MIFMNGSHHVVRLIVYYLVLEHVVSTMTEVVDYIIRPSR